MAQENGKTPDVEEPVELTGKDGNSYKAKKMGPSNLHIMEPWIRKRALADYLRFARDDRETTFDEQINTTAAIQMRVVSNDEIVKAWTSIAGALYVLGYALAPYNPKLTAFQIEDLFGDMLPETMAILYGTSGFDAEILTIEGGAKGAGNPTAAGTKPKTTGSGPPR